MLKTKDSGYARQAKECNCAEILKAQVRIYLKKRPINNIVVCRAVAMQILRDGWIYQGCFWAMAC
jgi:hypothetical protein